MGSIISACDLRHSALIEASAGTGKTYTITYLVLRLLLGAGPAGACRAPLELGQILVVTFTNAATADLRSRIYRKLVDASHAFERRCNDPHYHASEPDMEELLTEMEQRGPALLRQCVRILIRARRTIDTAPICTIHSFCYRVLSQVYAFEAAEAFALQFSDDISYIYAAAARDTLREFFYTAQPRWATYAALGTYANPLSLQKLITDYVGWVRLGYGGEALGQKFAVYSFGELDPCQGSAANFARLSAQLEEQLQGRLAECNAALERFQHSAACARLPELVSTAAANTLVPGPLYRFRDGKSRKFSKKAASILAACRQAAVCSDCRALLRCPLEAPGLPATLLSQIRRYAQYLENAEEILELEGQILDFAQALQHLQEGGARHAQELALVLACHVIRRVEEHLDREHLISNDEVILRLGQVINQQGAAGRLARMIVAHYRVALIDEFQDTDPVQFAIFKSLYLDGTVQLRDESGPACCYLIGDPKQSIYAFRGSDINSYLQARTLIERQERGALYTLESNYRSTPALVSAINALFTTALNPGNDRPFADGRIAYVPVTAQSSAARFIPPAPPGDGDGAAAPQADIYMTFAALPAPDANRRITAPQLREGCARCAAADISRTLLHGCLEAPDGTRRKVRPADIAVIVRNADESAIISSALAALNVPAVYESDRSSVLLEPRADRADGEGRQVPRSEARNISYLMAAMCQPRNRRIVLRLLGCGLLQLSGQEFLAQISDMQLENEIWLLESCAQLWEHYGLLPAFYKYMHAHQAMERMLAVPDGLRELSNCLHICELQQARHGHFKTLAAQYRDFVRSLTDEQQAFEQSMTRIRLNSQREQVRIITIHKSKGLEFPLVFLPFLFISRQARHPARGFTLFYNPEAGHQRRELDLRADEQCRALNCAQEQEEQFRQLYVALTRACSAIVMYVHAASTTPIQSRITDLLGVNTPEAIRTLCTAHPQWFVVRERNEEDLQQARHYRVTGPAVHGELAELPAAAIDRSFAIASFTSLVVGQHEEQQDMEPLLPEESPTAAAEMPEPYAAAEGSAVSVFSFPRGTQPGDFLHRLLEGLDFTCCHDAEYLNAVANAAVGQPQRSGYAFDAWCHDNTLAVEVLGRWLYDITHAVIYSAAGQSYCLAGLSTGDWVAEMRFLLPAQQLHTQELNRLCISQALSILGTRLSEVQRSYIEQLYLSPQVLSGFMTGSLDLTLRLPVGGRARYFVLDYKSTYLGDDYASYGSAGLYRNIFSNRNRYDIQYMLYSLALYRHLRARLPDFDYDADMGGVIYLYLRGLRAGSGSSGVFWTRPERRILEQLDSLCPGPQG